MILWVVIGYIMVSCCCGDCFYEWVVEKVCVVIVIGMSVFFCFIWNDLFLIFWVVVCFWKGWMMLF